MSLFELVRPVLFALDAEAAHEAALSAIAKGLIAGRTFSHPSLLRTVMGIQFPNPLGLAAGMDKTGKALCAWPDFGFGFVEIGTITRFPQPGNRKPRMWRCPAQGALINSLGFNNEGADAAASRLHALAERHGTASRVPLGVNLGKSKATRLEEAAEDYAYSYDRLAEHADYVTVNVSSPNTPGLRTLQDKDALLRIVGTLQSRRIKRPILVKVSPDLSEEALADVLQVAQTEGLAGLIATNTTVTRDGLPGDGPWPAGGMSGRPLAPLSRASLAFLARNRHAGLALISVGGISGPEEASERLAMGADLIQAYTGFVYGGPEWPASVLEGLAE